MQNTGPLKDQALFFLSLSCFVCLVLSVCELVRRSSYLVPSVPSVSPAAHLDVSFLLCLRLEAMKVGAALLLWVAFLLCAVAAVLAEEGGRTAPEEALSKTGRSVRVGITAAPEPTSPFSSRKSNCGH